MRYPPIARLLTVCCLLALMPLSQATSQGVRGQGGRAGEPAPCFRTDVPGHPVDILLGRPTDTSVTVSVLSSADAEGYVEWGAGQGEPSSRTQPVKLPADEPVQIALRGLAPDTAYSYRLRTRSGDGDFAPGETHHFHTQRAAGSRFTFTIVADSHLDERTNTDLYATTLRNALADAPDFHIDLGDTFMCDKVRPMGLPIRPMYLAQRYYLGLLCASSPLYFVTGNHDGETAGADPEALALRAGMLPNPVADGFYTGAAAGHGNYYAWSWGDALFVVLDPFTYSADRIRSADENWSRTLGEAQYRWLQQVLSESTAPLKLVFIHNLVGGLDRNGRGGAEAAPFFEWGGRGLDGSEQFAGRRPGWELPIHRLLAKHGVSIVFHGHDHLYARQELDGITYQAVPQPGWVGGRNVAQAAEYGYVSGDILPSSGHLRVAVAPDGATIDYVYAALPGAGGGAAPNASVVRSHSVPAGPRNPTGQ